MHTIGPSLFLIRGGSLGWEKVCTSVFPLAALIPDCLSVAVKASGTCCPGCDLQLLRVLQHLPDEMLRGPETTPDPPSGSSERVRPVQ